MLKTMRRKNFNPVLMCLTVIFLGGMLVGCVPGAIVEWEILPTSNSRELTEEIKQVREVLLNIGYSRLESGTDGKDMPQMEFFVSAKSQRWNIAIWQLQGLISVKFSEGGVKTLSSEGKQEVELIRSKFEDEFGKNHNIKMKNT
jgi:hypothetical protein